MNYTVEWLVALVPVPLVVFLLAPWLSLLVLIAFLALAAAALVAVAAAAVAAPFLLARTVHRRRRGRSAEPQQALNLPISARG